MSAPVSERCSAGTKAAGRRFDMARWLQHARNVLKFSRRLLTVLVLFGLVTADVAVCAGWAATPEDRMACCSEDACPMHEHDSAESGSHHDLTQAQADSCCAASERDDAAQPSSSAAPAFSLALVPSAAPVVLPEPVNTSHFRQTLVPIPRAHVPTHLLLSVLIV